MKHAIALFFIGFALGFAPSDRFDDKVRQKFFAGFAGDAAALAQGMAMCESILSENPKHAEAMVWYGSGIFMQAGNAFRANDQQKGIELYTRAIDTMERAVRLEPDNIGVRIPRGATLLSASRFMPPENGRPLLDTGLQDYEHVLRLQESSFNELGEHARGELLFGLAEGWSRAGNDDKARALFNRILKELPGTAYAKRAARWLQTGKLSIAETTCVGCHTGK